MEKQGNNNENIWRKCLENMRNNQFAEVKNCLLELKKDFIGLNDRELKDKK